MPKPRGKLTGSDIVIRGLATDLGTAQRELAELRSELALTRRKYGIAFNALSHLVDHPASARTVAREQCKSASTPNNAEQKCAYTSTK